MAKYKQIAKKDLQSKEMQNMKRKMEGHKRKKCRH